MDEEKKNKAHALWQRAYEFQMEGEYDQAIDLYQQSIAAHPTAEAHTFLGWTYSFQKRYQEAIAECKKASTVDPDFGNPYNDIGAYLIELGKPAEAIPWFKQAMVAVRYESRCFPHLNLGRVYEHQGRWAEATEEYRAALELNPDYRAARTALHRLTARFN